MRSALLAALLLAAGCGTGTDGKPVAPTTPAPAPGQPTAQAEARVRTRPSGPDGYRLDDEIEVTLVFRQPISFEGSPRLAIEIGEQVRLARHWPHTFPDTNHQWFRYWITADDIDPDGISIAADALDFSEGAFLNTAGVEVAAVITAVQIDRDPRSFEPGEDLAGQSVSGPREPRVCTDELAQARAYRHEAALVEEWDGTPFPIYFDEAIPASERADAEHFMGVAKRLADRIEDQVGYPIIELGGWLPVEKRTFDIRDGDLRDCERERPGEIIVTLIPDDLSYRAAARPPCAAFFWDDNHFDIRWDAPFSHELFHLFAFAHQGESGDYGLEMSGRLTHAGGFFRDLGVTFDDVDTLRCLFPEGGGSFVREPRPEPPGKPTGIRVVEVGQDFIEWAWDPVDGATGYEAEVFLAYAPHGQRGEPIPTVEPTIRAEGLEPGTEYEIYVRAVRQTAGGRAVGPWSATSPAVETSGR